VLPSSQLQWDLVYSTASTQQKNVGAMVPGFATPAKNPAGAVGSKLMAHP